MWEELDRKIGRTAIDKGIITNEVFLELMRIHNETELPMVYLLLEKKYAQTIELLPILTAALRATKQEHPMRKRLIEALVISQEALTRGFITPADRDQVILQTFISQGKQGVWDILKELKPNSAPYLQSLQTKLAREITICPNCLSGQNLSQWKGNTTITCRKCALPLAIPTISRDTPVPMGKYSEADLPTLPFQGGLLSHSPMEATASALPQFRDMEETQQQVAIAEPAAKSPPVDQQPEDPQTLAGGHGATNRYIILGPLGEGGMGMVLEAMDTYLRRRVAIKMLRPEIKMDEKNVTRFIHEAKATARLGHPNIVPIHDIGTSADGNVYFSMRLIKGESLADVLEQLRMGEAEYLERYSPRRLMNIFITVCQAISYAHSKGILHRDLKPENIMLGEFGEVQIMDWGLAKIRGLFDAPTANLTGGIGGGSAPVTLAGTIIGTPAYMSPEQAAAENDAIGEQSDIYSLGVILYELLTYQLPFNTAEIDELLTAIATQEPPLPSVRAPEKKIPKALDAICQKALKLDRNDRYKTPVEMAEDVQKFLEGGVVSVYRENRLTRFARWADRHWGRVIGGAFCIILVVVTVAFSVIIKNRRTHWNRQIESLKKEKKKYRDQLQKASSSPSPSKTNSNQARTKALNFYVQALQRERKKLRDNYILEMLNRALEADPNFAPAYRERGYIYERRGEVGRALKEYYQAWKLEPKNARLLYYMGSLLARKGVKLHGQSPRHYLQKAQEVAPKSSFGLLSQSHIHYLNHNYQKAIELAKKALISNPTPHFWQAYKILALSYLSWSRGSHYERMEQAKQYFDQLDRVRRFPDPLLHLRKAVLYRRLGHWKKGKSALAKALRLWPETRSSYREKKFARGLQHLWRYEIARAFAIFKKLAQKHPDNDEYQFYTAVSMRYLIKAINNPQLAHKKKFYLERTEKILSRYLSKHPDDVEAHFQLSELYIMDLKYKQSEKLLEKLVKKFPTDPRINIYLGHLYIHESKYGKAMKLLEQARTKLPHHPTVYSCIGECHFYQKNLVQSARNYAISGEKGDIQSMARAGIQYYNLKDYDRSRKLLEKSYEWSPTPQVKYYLDKIRNLQKKSSPPK